MFVLGKSLIVEVRDMIYCLISFNFYKPILNQKKIIVWLHQQ